MKAWLGRRLSLVALLTAEAAVVPLVIIAEIRS